MEYVGEETVVEEEGGDGGWVETHQLNEDGTAQELDKICELTLDDSKVSKNFQISLKIFLKTIEF